MNNVNNSKYFGGFHERALIWAFGQALEEQYYLGASRGRAEHCFANFHQDSSHSVLPSVHFLYIFDKCLDSGELLFPVLLRRTENSSVNELAFLFNFTGCHMSWDWKVLKHSRSFLVLFFRILD